MIAFRLETGRHASPVWMAAIMTGSFLVVLAKVRLASWTPDCLLFERMGHNIATGISAGASPVFTPPPLFVWLIALISKLGVSCAVAEIWISMTSFMLSALLIYLLGRQVFAEQHALLTAFAYILHPRFTHYAVIPLRTSLYVVLALATCYLTVRILASGRTVLLLPLALVGVLTSLTRPEGIEIPILALSFILVVPRQPEGRSRLLAASVILAGIGVVVATLLLSQTSTGIYPAWSVSSYVSRPVASVTQLVASKSGIGMSALFQPLWALVTLADQLEEAVYLPFLILALFGAVCHFRDGTDNVLTRSLTANPKSETLNPKKLTPDLIQSLPFAQNKLWRYRNHTSCFS